MTADMLRSVLAVASLISPVPALASQVSTPDPPPTSAAPTVAGPFHITVFADDLAEPEWMAFAPDGTLYVTLGGAGVVVALRDRDGDGRADDRAIIASVAGRFRGITWRDSSLWATTGPRILRFRPDTSGAPWSPSEVAVTREGDRVLGALRFGGSGLFVAAAICDTCGTDLEGGRILRYDPGTGEAEVWARGLREPRGLAVDPVTGELWATDGAADPAGDPIVPDEINVVARGRHYGWPACYGMRVPHATHADPDRCDLTSTPLLLFPGGSGVGDLAFYRGEWFPPEYRGDLFVVVRGSSTGRVVPPRVLRIRLDRRRRPVAVETFVDGWWGPDGRVRGEPVQSLVGPDGAVYVSDALGRCVWRIVPTELPAPGSEAPVER